MSDVIIMYQSSDLSRYTCCSRRLSWHSSKAISTDIGGAKAQTGVMEGAPEKGEYQPVLYNDIHPVMITYRLQLKSLWLGVSNNRERHERD